jgi:excisionase family DNA binding protein
MPTKTGRPLSVAEIADSEKIPGRTVRHAISTGELKAAKLPGRTGAYLISPADLRRWLDSRTGPIS